MDAMRVLKRYQWPGNIRELENVIEHCFVMESSNMIILKSLPDYILKATQTVLPELDDLAEELYIPQSKEKSKVIDASERFLKGLPVRESLTDFEDDNFVSDDWLKHESNDIVINSNSEHILDFNAEKEAFEREFIIKALKMFKGRINQTALHANIPKKTLLRKIEKYGINTKDYQE